VGAVEAAKTEIQSQVVKGLTSDQVLGILRPALVAQDYRIEGGKHKTDKIRRPVLFGDEGAERVAYEVDGFHDEKGIVIEVEAGRGALGNAVYRDLVRASLIVGAKYLTLGVMQEYHYKNGGKEMLTQSYRDAKALLDAVYASGRLKLPFDGVLLFGY